MTKALLRTLVAHPHLDHQGVEHGSIMVLGCVRPLGGGIRAAGPANPGAPFRSSARGFRRNVSRNWRIEEKTHRRSGRKTVR